MSKSGTCRTMESTFTFYIQAFTFYILSQLQQLYIVTAGIIRRGFKTPFGFSGRFFKYDSFS